MNSKRCKTPRNLIHGSAGASPFRSSYLRLRCAFTLLELMLVLALMVALAGLAYPSIIGMFESQRLYKAADQVRAAWAKARNEALSSGRTMIFRYQPQTDLYFVGPWQGEAADAQAQTDSDSASTTADAATATAIARQWHLPEGILFVDSTSQVDSRSDMVTSSDTGGADFDTTAAPILFYPDGTTSTAQIQLTATRGQTLQVEIRGLTGVTRVGEVTSQNAER